MKRINPKELPDVLPEEIINTLALMADEIPEDLLKNLEGCFFNGSAKSDKALSLMNEFNEGKYWLDKGEEVIISKELSPGKTPPDEVDVVFISGSNKGILECKYPNVKGTNAEMNIFSNLELIIKKFREDGKLTGKWKNMYPKRFGQINIANGTFPNLSSADEFVNLVKNCKLSYGTVTSLIGEGAGKMFTLQELKSLQELHIIVGNKRIIVKPSNW